MTWSVFCITCVAMATITFAGRIITVVDQNFLYKNSDLKDILEPNPYMNTDMTVIVSTDNDTNATFEEVCDALSKGAFMLLDIASPNIGPLLRSFARAHGLVFLTMIDISEELAGDRDDALYVRIEPPGSSMLNVVSDMILKDNLTNVAILYDDSFKLHQIPRRLVTGLLSHHIYHEIRKNEMKQLLDHLHDLEIENVIVIGSATSIDFVLGQANEHAEELRETMNWFAITKDAKITCDHCLAKMRTVVASGAASFDKRNHYIDFMRNFDRGYTSLHIRIDEAFVYDLLTVFDEHLPENPGLIKSNSCYSDVTTGMIDGDQIVNSLMNINHEGVFGQLVSSARVIQQKIKLNIRKVIFNQGKEFESTSVGIWTEDEGLNVTVDSLTRERSQKNYKVVIVPEYEPFIYKHTSYANGSVVNYTYTGFCIELFDKIAETLGFTYDVHETEDGFFGSLNEDGTWNGAIQELIEKKADIAIGPISVMSERENVVDFTVPFHEPVGLTILMRKQEFEYSLHRFLKVLEANVWGVIVAAYFLFAILMWVFDKFSPYSYQNDPEGSLGPEKRVFTLKEGIWFCMTSLTPQGGGEAPKAISGRILAAFWWLYGFLLIAFYTANLAAFLTVTRLETPISSLDDLSAQQSVKYGPMNGTSALVYFQRMAQIEDRFYTIWKGMSLNDSLSPVDRAKLAVWDYPVSEKFTKLYERMHVPNSYAEALRMVKAKEFAFIDDATRNKYQTLIDCDVEAIGVEFSRKPFAFAVTQGSPLRAQMSNVILELANKRFMEDLTNKWWESNKMKKECPTIEDESDGISLMNIGGVFLVIAIGTGMSLIAFVVEYYIYKIKPQRESRLYDINRRGCIEEKPMEVNINDLQIDVAHQNGGSKIPKNEINAENNHRRKSSNKIRLRNGSSKGHKQNGFVSNKQTHREETEIDDNDNHKVSNGHVQNGGINQYFIFDTDDTIEERYPSIRQQEETQNVIMTHI